jgi:LuxR family transcriptional regulator, maltose regulon positive regulatory protein
MSALETQIPGLRLDERGFVERLTPRELTIVELLPTHLSYGQIGEELFVSVNTVKSNLKSIYRKLGATNRHEAVAAARGLGLLER